MNRQLYNGRTHTLKQIIMWDMQELSTIVESVEVIMDIYLMMAHNLLGKDIAITGRH